MEVNDAEWLAAYAGSGHAEAFTQLVDRHAGWVLAAARRRLNDEQLAEDAAQAVFLLLAEKADEVARSDRASLTAWLFHAMHFTCCGLRRTRSRQAKHEGMAATMARGGAPADGAETIAALEEVIAEPPPRDREAIVRRYSQREPFADTGQSLGIGAEAARKRVSRLLDQCRAAMAGGFGVDPWLPPEKRQPDEGITKRTMTKVKHLDVVAGHLQHLADASLVGPLARLDAAAGQGPAAVVGALLQQHAALVVQDDGARAGSPLLRRVGFGHGCSFVFGLPDGRFCERRRADVDRFPASGNDHNPTRRMDDADAHVTTEPRPASGCRRL